MSADSNTLNIGDGRLQVDMRIEVEPLAIFFQVLAVLFGGQEVRSVGTTAEVGESGELSRRYHLRVLVLLMRT